MGSMTAKPKYTMTVKPVSGAVPTWTSATTSTQGITIDPAGSMSTGTVSVDGWANISPREKSAYINWAAIEAIEDPKEMVKALVGIMKAAPITLEIPVSQSEGIEKYLRLAVDEYTAREVVDLQARGFEFE